MGKTTQGNAGEENVMGQRMISPGAGGRVCGDEGQHRAECSRVTGSAARPSTEGDMCVQPMGQEMHG